MADEGNIISTLNLGNGEDTSPAAGLISQYIKDLSVENPNAPQSYQWQDPPQLDIQFNISARAIEGEVHEVELKIVATARAQAGIVYVVDLAFGSLVGLRNLDEASIHAFLYAEAPRLLFPFARRILADAVRDAGYAPMLLDPIDFNALYVQQLSAQAEATANPVGNA